MGWRKYPENAYNLGHYKPESGWTSYLTFGAGELGNLGSRGPAILELNDTSLVVFTKSYVRKIACPGETLSIEWTKPISLAPLSFPNAAVAQGGNTIFVTSQGEVSAVNHDGLRDAGNRLATQYTGPNSGHEKQRRKHLGNIRGKLARRTLLGGTVAGRAVFRKSEGGSS